MSETMTPDEIEQALEGTSFDLLGDVLLGSYATGDFQGAVRVLDAAAVVAEQANHHPDVRLGYGRIEFELSSHDVDTVTRRDVDLALRIEQVATGLGATPEN
ncbi:4a-hydroxytetrahydrobiopterin dehydratase [Agromyces archimandritae]|uniref:Putative pterin-4-alpha-carbinolamine dehydratase n=1 Tax=Agromyces archimandritae TaxID=2781962 RepID=A0A975INX7_9MICO|nr:4a-hydroxytetrahydrobiopterin dehydratase [Agromyces archimandritae]QTX05047.1 4a-hydroxytetrahydrobiopterin dehydratase [Agromyces archimandritae]